MMNKVLLCVIVALVYTVNAVPVDSSFEVPKIDESQYNEVPESQFQMKSLNLDAEPDYDLLNEINRNPNNNLYLLYTRNNPTTPQILKAGNDNSIISSNFNANVPTIVIVHGWLGNQEANLNSVIKDAFLAKDNVNVIVLDWKRLAISNYVTAARGVPAVGRGLGEFLAHLTSVSGAPYNSMHLVGFSLGAHLVGNAGRFLEGRVARITALDPAGPLWYTSSRRVNPDDAIYVEAIHTDGGYTVGGLGIGRAVAKADFFVNGGTSQPGCLTNICNHNRAWRTFAATVTYNHLVGRECSNSLQINSNLCRGAELRMGNGDINKVGFGRYRVNTKRRYPY